MTDNILPNFSALVSRFNKLVENNPPPNKIKGELELLKSIVTKSGGFTIRQMAALTDRVDNYLKGDYGNTKKEEHYGHAKPEKK